MLIMTFSTVANFGNHPLGIGYGFLSERQIFFYPKYFCLFFSSVEKMLLQHVVDLLCKKSTYYCTLKYKFHDSQKICAFDVTLCQVLCRRRQLLLWAEFQPEFLQISTTISPSDKILTGENEIEARITKLHPDWFLQSELFKNSNGNFLKKWSRWL